MFSLLLSLRCVSFWSRWCLSCVLYHTKVSRTAVINHHHHARTAQFTKKKKRNRHLFFRNNQLPQEISRRLCAKPAGTLCQFQKEQSDFGQFSTEFANFSWIIPGINQNRRRHHGKNPSLSRNQAKETLPAKRTRDLSEAKTDRPLMNKPQSDTTHKSAPRRKSPNNKKSSSFLLPLQGTKFHRNELTSKAKAAPPSCCFCCPYDSLCLSLSLSFCPPNLSFLQS